MRRFLLAPLFLVLTPTLRAQIVEIYGTVNAVHATNVPANNGSDTGNPLTTNTIYSFGLGGTFNFLSAGVAKLGVDVRGSDHTALGGIKLTVKPPVFRVTPYLQGSLGYLNVPHNSTDNKYAVAEILGGIDAPLTRILDYRVIEIGGGHAINSTNGSKPSFLTLTTGLVFHF